MSTSQKPGAGLFQSLNVRAKLKHPLGKPPREPSTPFGTLAFWIF
jgi:hypothetical protein